MNIERGVGRHRVGGWDFSPSTGELRQRADVRRLEPRAARALELLCKANGEVVSQEQLIAGVWNGRALSDNSVAVVIGQLRRALDDDAREPKLIETIPKRGYRLRTDSMRPGPEPQQQRRMLIAAALLMVLVTALAATIAMNRPALSVVVSDVTNETGESAYAPLARATNELIIDQMGARGISIRRSGEGDLRIASKLIIWDGLPFLSMTATDGSDMVRWSAMIEATPGRVPAGVSKALDKFVAQFPAGKGDARVADAKASR